MLQNVYKIKEINKIQEIREDSKIKYFIITKLKIILNNSGNI